MKVRNSGIKLVGPLSPRRHTHSYPLMLCPGHGHPLDLNSRLWYGPWYVSRFHASVPSVFWFYSFLLQQLSLWTVLSILDRRYLIRSFSHRLTPRLLPRGLMGLPSQVHRSAQLHQNQLHQDACIIIALLHSEILNRSLFPIMSHFNSPPSLASIALAPVFTNTFLTFLKTCARESFFLLFSGTSHALIYLPPPRPSPFFLLPN